MPAAPHVYLVFAQRQDARLDVDAWNAHAERFFATKLGATTPRSTDAPLRALADEAEIVVLHGEPPGEVRHVTSRPVTPADLALADRAEALHPGGLGLLARRCPHVYEVTRAAPDDRVALRLAAIVASVVLGPIVDAHDADAPRIFGVKTARALLTT
jgi:hypothetical protein